MHPYLCFSRIYLCEAITSLSPKGINMKTAVGSIILASILTTGAAGAATVNVGGAAMLPQKNIVENALNSKDHTTLVAAVKAAGLVDTLQGKGPFRSEEHTSELQSIMSISYDVFCWKKNKKE